MHDKSIDYATARVTKIDKVLKRRQLEHIRRNNPLLGDGIVQRTMEELEGNLKSVSDLFDEVEITESLLAAALLEYLSKIEKPDEIDEDLHKDFTVGEWLDYLPELYLEFGEWVDEYAVLVAESNRTSEKHHQIEWYKHMLKDALLLGDMDKELCTDRGSILNLLSTTYRLRKSVPRRIYHFFAYADEMTSEECKREEKKLRESYGFQWETGGLITSQVFLSDWVGNDLNIPTKEVRSLLLRGELISKINGYCEDFRRQGLPYPWLTKRRVRGILREHNLENLLFLREEDFIWEQFV
jgi:hypothetical protein